MATFPEVNRAVLWVSHIVIMCKKSYPHEPSLRPAGWSPDPPMPDRSENEALSRALHVAELAAKAPQTFAELARQYSDDVVTRDHGGSLGGVRAGQLPPEYRDALAVLRPGETSRVVRTALGYHVLLRRPVPPDGRVAGKRIVVRYQGTLGGARRTPSTRSRDAARALADRVASLARESPGTFDALVREYSESDDAASSGDMGLWSLRDPDFMPREVEILGELGMGEVSAPIDSPFGFEILMKTDAAERPRYAMQAVEVAYDPAAADGADASRAGALRRATELAGALRRDPSRFEALQRQICCLGAQQWTLGRGPAGVARAVEALRIGEIAAQPIEVGPIFFLPRRDDPASVPAPPEPTYELPSPRAPDLDTLVRTVDGPTLAASTKLLAADVVNAVPSAAAARDVIDGELEALATLFDGAGNGDSRVEALHATLARLKARLPPKTFDDFQSFLEGWTARMFLSEAGSRPRPGAP